MTEKKPMLSAAEALNFLLEAVRPVTEIETLPTLRANGRVLADDACVYVAKDMRVSLVTSAD